MKPGLAKLKNLTAFYTPLLFTRMSCVCLQFLIVLFVGRYAGPQGIGLLQLFTAMTCLLGELVAVGLPTHAMKSLASTDQQPSQIRQFLFVCSSKVTALWLTLSIIGGVLIAFDHTFIAPTTPPWLRDYILPLALSTLAFAFMRLASESLKARYRINTSILLENGLPGLIAATFLLSSWFLFQNVNSVSIVTGITTGYLVTAVVLGITLLWNIRQKEAPEKLKTSTIDTHWSLHTPFWITSLVSISFINLPFLMMPYFSSLAEIGQFALAFKLLGIVTTVLIMLASVFGPRFARCRATGNMQEVKKLLGQSQLLTLGLYLPLTTLILVFYKDLNALFGGGFEGGFLFFCILATGQVINAATGLSGVALNMLGRGKQEMWIQIVSLAFILFTAPIAGSIYGATGIATVYALTLSIKSVLSLNILLRYLKQTITNPQSINTNIVKPIGAFA